MDARRSVDRWLVMLEEAWQQVEVGMRNAECGIGKKEN